MSTKIRILFVEDNLTDAELICHEIEINKILFSKLTVDNKADYEISLRDFEPDLIISDYSMPHFDGMTALRIRNRKNPQIPFILVTGSVNEEIAVECMKNGADDYVLKDNLSRLAPAILNSIRKAKLEKEKTKAEQELLKSEMMLKKAQAIARVGNWELDLSLKKIWFSSEALRIYGLNTDVNEYPGDILQKLTLPEDTAALDEALDRLLKYNEPYETEYKIKRKSDSVIRSLYSRAELFIEPDGEQVKVIGIVQDITDKKKSEEALKQSELRFMQISEHSGEWIWEIDQKGLYSYSNSIVKEILGYTPEEIVNKKYFYDFFLPETRDDLKESILYALSQKVTLKNYTNHNLHKNGNVVILSTSCIPIFDSGGNLTGYRGVDTDITKQIMAEEAASQERRMLRTLIDNLPDPIYVQDIECRKVIANKADLENIGCISENEVLGKTDIDLFPGEIGRRGFEDDKKVIVSGKPVYNLEEEFITKDGNSRWLQTTKIPLFDKDGIVTGLVGIGHDITEKKKSEEELIKAKEKAEESDRLKTAFLHNISHEIRTPMNSIIGFSALLSEPDLDDDSRKLYIETIMQSSNHLLSIINDIVDIASIEANLVKVTNIEVNINSLLKTLHSQFLPRAAEKKIEFSLNEILPDTDALIFTDRTKLTQILTNLISNAIKFTERGKVNISYRVVQNYIEFCVSDTGIGISPEHHKRIFERFYQVHGSLKRLYEGTGLGLAITKAYVENLGGEIRFVSEPDKGSSFYFTIPYEKHIALVTPVGEKDRSDKFELPVQKVVLVAEDIESNFKLICHFLAGSNIEILHASNGKEAVEKCLSAKKIDLILMDIKMPVMDGYTAVRIIRERFPDIPIIAQTAYADDEEKAIDYGCTAYISKPFDKKSLFKILNKYI